MLIAAFLAVAVHMGLMNFEFAPKKILVPSVSLPRSVSIFLRQSSIVQSPNQPVKKTQNVSPIKEEHLKAEKEQEMPVLQKAPAIQEKPNSSFQPSALLEKTVKQPSDLAEEKNKPAVEEIMPAYQKTKDLKPEPVETVKVQEPVKQTKSQPASQNDGVSLPGTLQMAYPRYQLNAPPKYPGLARKRGQAGTVILQVLINKEGRVDDLEIDVSSNFSLLDRAAVTAVREWSFEPGMQGEEKVSMWVRVPVTFKLKK